MIPCAVIRDLFLLYESKECSNETNIVVEEHVKECESCRIELEKLMKPVQLVTYDEDELLQKDLSAKKGLKIIRRRWIISLICIAMILPLFGLGILTKNEITKEGICFSNLDDLYYSKSFFKAIQNKDYERAFTYLDVEAVYDQLINGYVFSEREKRYEVEIGEETWYIDESLYLNEYQTYINNEDESEIWMSLILANSSHNGRTAIPKEKMTEELLNQINTSDEGINIVIDEKNASLDEEDIYYLWQDDTGREFYYLGQEQQTDEGTEILDDALFLESRCIPQRVYDDLMESRKEEETVIKAYVDYYKDMGFETYKEKSKKYFLENMKRFEEEGFTISSFKLVPYYYYNEPNRSWEITASLKVYKDGSLCTETYQYENGMNETRNSIDIISTDNGVIIHSSYLGMRLAQSFSRAINYLGITEDVDNYFSY